MIVADNVTLMEVDIFPINLIHRLWRHYGGIQGIRWWSSPSKSPIQIVHVARYGVRGHNLSGFTLLEVPVLQELLIEGGEA